MAELADAVDSKSTGSNPMGVRISPEAPVFSPIFIKGFVFRVFLKFMKQKEYNLNFNFDKNLHDIPENPKEMELFILEQKQNLASVSDPLKRIKIMMNIGGYSRMLNNLKEAEYFLNEAMNLINKHDMQLKFWVINRIRLAHLHQFKKDYKTSEKAFHEIIEICKSRKEVSSYLHFAFQHIGKLYFDMRKYDLALQSFKGALKIRRKIGNKNLIESTQFAIHRTKEVMKIKPS